MLIIAGFFVSFCMKLFYYRNLMALISGGCLLNFIHAQTNLVANPGFEIYDTCPNNLSQITRAVGWYSAKLSPDYFNSCTSASSWSAVPSNYWGYQSPVSGDAYSGYAASYGGDQSIKEFLGTQLVTPLQTNTKYFVSFKVCRSYKSSFMNDCSVNKLGVLFSTVQYSINSPAPICNCAQVYTDSIIQDTLNWTQILGSFIADSNYSYLNIGNFFTNALTDSIQTQGTFCNTYYYVDEVCVSDDSAFCADYSIGINDYNQEIKISCFPNPTSDFVTINSQEATFDQLKLYNLTGQVVKNVVVTNEQVCKLSLCDLPKGYYALIIMKKSSPVYRCIVTKL
jgi:hypothetical protein